MEDTILKKNMNLIFLDTETTGNDTKVDRLCQLCYKTEEGIWTEYFKPPIPIPVKAMSITHITNKTVADKPAFQGSQMRKDLEILLSSGAILVAHNADFDCAILANEGLGVARRICTLRVARHLDDRGVIPEYGLQFLRYYLGLEIDAKPHDAEGDVLVLSALFDRLFSKVREKFKTDEEAIEEMIRISTEPTVFKKLTFGKYKGEYLADILERDRPYLEWLLKEKQKSAKDNDKDWVYTLKKYLK